MNKYNNTGTQVFLGWTDEVPNRTDPPYYPEPRGGSPQYEYPIDDNYNFANVAGSFWYYMCNGYTVDDALDALCDDIYNADFAQTELYEWLIVWGNMNLDLP